MKKRTLAMLFASALVLAACNATDDKEQAEETAEETTEETATASTYEVFTLTEDAADVTSKSVEYSADKDGNLAKFLLTQIGLEGVVNGTSFSEDGKTLIVDFYEKGITKDQETITGPAAASFAEPIKATLFTNMPDLQQIAYTADGQPTDGWSDLTLAEVTRAEWEATQQ